MAPVNGTEQLSSAKFFVSKKRFFKITVNALFIIKTPKCIINGLTERYKMPPLNDNTERAFYEKY